MLETIQGRITIKQIFQDEHRHWERFRKKHEGKLRPAILENVQKLLDCRDPLKLGYHLYRCPTKGCSFERMVPHSCKSRFCPSCGKVATDNWMEKALSSFIDVPYHHVVFTTPSELRGVFGWKRKLMGVLFTAAKETVLSICREKYGYIPGIVMVQHTFGSDLWFKPHIHMLITQGGLSLDKRRWVHNEFIPWDQLKSRWKYHVVMKLRPRLKEMIQEKSAGETYARLGTHRLFRSFLGQAVQQDMVCVDGSKAL